MPNAAVEPGHGSGPPKAPPTPERIAARMNKKAKAQAAKDVHPRGVRISSPRVLRGSAVTRATPSAVHPPAGLRQPPRVCPIPVGCTTSHPHDLPPSDPSEEGPGDDGRDEDEEQREERDVEGHPRPFPHVRLEDVWAQEEDHEGEGGAVANGVPEVPHDRVHHPGRGLEYGPVDVPYVHAGCGFPTNPIPLRNVDAELDEAVRLRLRRGS